MAKSKPHTGEKYFSKAMSPGKLLAAGRAVKKYSQAEVEYALGIKYKSSQFISRVERDLTILPLKYIKPICKLYGMPTWPLRKMMADVEIKVIKIKYGV